jgi:hypothetical protein
MKANQLLPTKNGGFKLYKFRLTFRFFSKLRNLYYVQWDYTILAKRWAGRIWQSVSKCHYIILVESLYKITECIIEENPVTKTRLESISPGHKFRAPLVNLITIKMDVREICYENMKWLLLAYDMGQRRALPETDRDLQSSSHCLAHWTTVDCWRQIVYSIIPVCPFVWKQKLSV